MNWPVLLVIAIPLGVLLALVALSPMLVRRWRTRQESQAVEMFALQREQLEAKFFDLARGRGKPRGLVWVECDWLDGVTFGRSVADGLLTAFAGVNIRFEAVEGGDMEDVEAVGLIRVASAIFHFQHGRWGTGGRALFNMDPQDALQKLEGQFEPVA